MKYCVCGAAYRIEGNDSIVMLSCRDLDGNRAILTDVYRPYFYTPVSYLKKLDKLRELYPSLDDSIVDISYGFLSIDGASLAKITVTIPPIVGEFNRAVESNRRSIGYIPLYESHIPFELRYMIDKDIVTGVTDDLVPIEIQSNHRIMYLDIETTTVEDKDIKRYIDPIIVIGIYDQYTDKYYEIYSSSCRIDSLEVDNIELIPVSNEIELLKAFRDLYIKLDPDVIVTFTKFDMRYLINLSLIHI